MSYIEPVKLCQPIFITHLYHWMNHKERLSNIHVGMIFAVVFCKLRAVFAGFTRFYRFSPENGGTLSKVLMKVVNATDIIDLRKEVPNESFDY